MDPEKSEALGQPDLKNGEYGERVVEGIVANSVDIHEDPEPGQGWTYLVHMKDD